MMANIYAPVKIFIEYVMVWVLLRPNTPNILPELRQSLYIFAWFCQAAYGQQQ